MLKLTPEQLAALRAVPVTERTPNRVRVAIAMAAVRQDEIVAVTGINKSQLSKIVNGRAGTIDVITEAQPLADYFGCSTDDLFPRQGVAA